MKKEKLIKLERERRELLNYYAQKDFLLESQKSIYIIDNDEMSLELLKTFIIKMNANFRVQTFSDEMSLLSKIKESQPDLVVVDYHLDSLKGDDLMNMIDSITLFDMNYLVVSGDEKRLKMLDHDIDRLPKPINYQHFDRLVSKKLIAA